MNAYASPHALVFRPPLKVTVNPRKKTQEKRGSSVACQNCPPLFHQTLASKHVSVCSPDPTAAEPAYICWCRYKQALLACPEGTCVSFCRCAMRPEVTVAVPSTSEGGTRPVVHCASVHAACVGGSAVCKRASSGPTPWISTMPPLSEGLKLHPRKPTRTTACKIRPRQVSSMPQTGDTSLSPTPKTCPCVEALHTL